MNYKYHDIAVEDVLKDLDDFFIVDVRSPKEFLEDYIEGAVNIPLLDDEERKIIGTLYKEEGMRKAKEVGRKLILPNLGNRLTEIHDSFVASQKKRLLVYCARGGDRSKIMATLLAFERGSVFRLTNGYKAYRKEVVNYFEKQSLPSLKVLYGLTGAGKTDLLLDLKDLNYPVIDLEGLANHRGSVFGHVGQEAQPSQKWFESRLFFLLRKPVPYFIVEGESKKIGRISLPNTFYQKLLEGQPYLVDCSIENRILRLQRDYGKNFDLERKVIDEALNYLTIRLGKNTIKEIGTYLDTGNMDQAIKILLVDYYDVLYEKNRKKTQDYIQRFSSDDYTRCLEVMKEEFK